MWWWLLARVWADETGATLDCVAEDADCVTTGGLVGLCDADLECVTSVCEQTGDTCTVDGEWGTCAEAMCEPGQAGGCSTTPGAASALLGASGLLASRRRGRR